MKPAVVEVWARPATDEETPRAAQQMRTVAELGGWKVVSTYARARRDDRLIETLALRMGHQERRQRAVAIWANGNAASRQWRFDCGFRWGEGVYFGKLKANDLKRWLRDVSDQG